MIRESLAYDFVGASARDLIEAGLVLQELSSASDLTFAFASALTLAFKNFCPLHEKVLSTPNPWFKVGPAISFDPSKTKRLLS